jgi:hypothetical protein
MVSSPYKYNYALPRHTVTDTDKMCNQAGQDKGRDREHISVLEELAGHDKRREKEHISVLVELAGQDERR